MLNRMDINYNKINGFDRQWGCKEHIERGKKERWIKGKWNCLNRKTSNTNTRNHCLNHYWFRRFHSNCLSITKYNKECVRDREKAKERGREKERERELNAPNCANLICRKQINDWER